jgi:cell pole-organizing protein PopZ
MPTEGSGGGESGEEEDWQMAPDSDASFPEDTEKRELLREVAEEVRARDDSSEASQVAAFLYRVSDLYKAGEETSPAEIYLNMRHIMDIKAQGGLDRGREE